MGGKGGRVEGSYTGTLTLDPSMDGALDADVLLVAFDRAEVVDIVEITEEMDSFESRLLDCSDGRRGGSAGDFCTEAFRGGSRGGGGGDACEGLTRWPVLIISGGG